jgi:hypothetical protein
MDAANGAATATISNGGTPVAPTDRTAVDTLVGRNITDHTAPDATALRECHFGEQQHPRQRCEQAGEKRALVGHGAIIAARRGEKEGPDGRSGNAALSGELPYVFGGQARIRRAAPECGRESRPGTPAAVKQDESILPEAECPAKDTVPYSASCIAFLTGWFWQPNNTSESATSLFDHRDEPASVPRQDLSRNR